MSPCQRKSPDTLARRNKNWCTVSPTGWGSLYLGDLQNHLATHTKKHHYYPTQLHYDFSLFFAALCDATTKKKKKENITFLYTNCNTIMHLVKASICINHHLFITVCVQMPLFWGSCIKNVPSLLWSHECKYKLHFECIFAMAKQFVLFACAFLFRSNVNRTNINLFSAFIHTFVQWHQWGKKNYLYIPIDRKINGHSQSEKKSGEPFTSLIYV